MKKKIVAALLCVAILVSVCACGNGEGDTEKNSEKTPATPPTLTSLAAFDDLKEVLKGDYEITEEAIADYFTSILCAKDAGLIEVTDRDTVQEGDIVQVDYTGYLDDEAFNGGEADNQIIDVSGNCAFDEATGSTGNTYIDDFSDGLIGAKVKTPVKHNVTFPTNYSNTDLAGKETTFEFNVDKIYIKATPDTVTDEYVAKHLGEDGYTTIDALVTYSKEELAVSMVMGYVINESKLDISEEYLNERLALYEEFIAETSGTSDISTIVYYSYGMTLEQIRPYWLAWIKSQVTAEVVFAEIVKSKNLSTDEKELEEFVEDVLDENSSFESEEDVYNAVSYGSPETGRTYILHEFAVKEYILEQYRTLQTATE